VAPPNTANEIIEGELASRVRALEELILADVISYTGPIDDLAQSLFKGVIEDWPPRRNRLAVLLETYGGFIEDAERLANILRHHYDIVDFYVTTYAMSAGTVLVMSGDSIYMDYSATLGPIDPQLQREGSPAFVPALGYLEQYNRLVQKSADGTITTAELAFLIQNFDAAELYQYEQSRDLSIALLKEWLVRYKFKNWDKTETRGTEVTEDMKVGRAKEVATALNDTDRWHSHSRGITRHVLQNELVSVQVPARATRAGPPLWARPLLDRRYGRYTAPEAACRGVGPQRPAAIG